MTGDDVQRGTELARELITIALLGADPRTSPAVDELRHRPHLAGTVIGALATYAASLVVGLAGAQGMRPDDLWAGLAVSMAAAAEV